MSGGQADYQLTVLRMKIEKHIKAAIPPKLGLCVKTKSRVHWQLQQHAATTTVLADIWPTVTKWRIMWPHPRTPKAEQGSEQLLIAAVGEIAEEFAKAQEKQTTGATPQNYAKLPTTVGDKPPEFVPLANRPVQLTLSGEAEKFIKTISTRQKPNIELIVSPGQMRVILTTTSSSESFLIAHAAADDFFEQAVKYRKLFRSEEPPAVNRNQKQEN